MPEEPRKLDQRVPGASLHPLLRRAVGAARVAHGRRGGRSNDACDLLDRDPQTIADLAYLDALLGLTPPATPPMSEQRFDELFNRAVTAITAGNERARQTSRYRFADGEPGVAVLHRLLCGLRALD